MAKQPERTLPLKPAAAHPGQRRRATLATAAPLVGVLAAGVVTLPTAQAQDGEQTRSAEQRYDIAPGPLTQVLNRFAVAAGIDLAGASELTADRQSDGLEGEFTVDEALQRLLAGTGVDYRFTDGDTVTLTEADSESLEPIRVKAPRETAYGPVDGYRATRSATATRTDTAIQDTPASIQVVSREVMDDQNAQDVREAVRNVSGVFVDNSFGGIGRDYNIRGFNQEFKLRNGFREQGSAVFRSQELANVERVEVLKGPASITSGRLAPGGVVNVVTKRPTAQPLSRVELESGTTSEGGALFQPSVDLSGPLTEDGAAKYRLNALYSSNDSYREPFEENAERAFVAPVASFELGSDTDLLVELEYTDDERPFDRGVVFFDGQFSDRDRNLQSPTVVSEVESTIASYTLEHRFTDNLRLRHRSQVIDVNRFNLENVPFAPATDFPSDYPNAERGDFARFIGSNDRDNRTYSTQTELLADIDGPLAEHSLLFALDFSRDVEDGVFQSTDSSFAFPEYKGEKNKINIFDPNDKVPAPTRDDLTTVTINERTETEEYGVLLQDQMTLSPQWELLLGGRLSWFDQETVEKIADNEDTKEVDAEFSPRAGVVYTPIAPVSLYASYSESYEPNTARDRQGDLLEPTEGEQYEAGVKAEFLDRRLRTTLAGFEVTKTNIPESADAPGANFSKPIGEERTRGVELDVTGRITDGWSAIGSYAYLDTEITEDDSNEGNELSGVPEHSASLWSNYRIQSGTLSGLKLGAGLFYRGEREADKENSFELPSFTRVDARVGYQRKDWEVNLTLKNVFDTEDNYTATDTFSLVQPGTPFTAIASMSVNF